MGWMMLAWNNTIQCVREVDGHLELLDITDDSDKHKIERHITEVIDSQRLTLNNALALLQQSLEMFLKSVIAEVSPFLLIAGDPQHWPGLDCEGVVDFSQFRTVDAVHLCKTARIVGRTEISDKFVNFFEEQRKVRNAIMHLDTGALVVEATTLLVSVMKAHSLVSGGQTWQSFRAKHISADNYDEDDGPYGDDISHDIYLSEMDILIDRLAPKDLRLYIGYETRKRRFKCHACWNLTSSDYDGHYEYVQKQGDGSFKCVACSVVFGDRATYETAAELM